MSSTLSRRQILTHLAATAGVGLSGGLDPAKATAAEQAKAGKPFRFCLNTSTLMGQKLDIIELIEIASKVGYEAIEPWLRELDEYVKAGGNLKDLGNRVKDRGLAVESAIAFFEWMVDDPQRRRKGLEDARRSMDMVLQIGGRRVAAPPAGVTQQDNLDLRRAADRYRELLKLGDQIGVVPQVELWGFSRALSRLGEVAYVAAEASHPKSCILLDVYHLHKGGSAIDGLRLFSSQALQVIHFNDYPAQPSRASITDAHRVYPGDGVAPLPAILQTLRSIGFGGALSLELFNREYWKLDALSVARTGLEKMKAVVERSLASASS